jgi:hypothetical protein
MTRSRILPELRAAWDATEAAPDEPDAAELRARDARRQDADREGRDSTKAKGKAAGRRHGERFAVLNAFVDFTLAELTRAETAVWLTLYRDTKAADGLARTSQADMARRAGVNVRTAKRAVVELCRRGLLTVVFRGNLRRGPSTYRVRALTLDAKK